MESKRAASNKKRPWFKVWPGHLPKNLDYPEVPAWWIIEHHIGRFADKTAIIFLNHEDLSEIERVTYGELWQKANALAHGLREIEVGKEDRVATLLPNSPATIISYYGIWMSGASITPCNAMAKEKELKYQLNDSGARVLIAADTFSSVAAPVAEELGVKLILASVGEKADTNGIKNALDFGKMINSGKTRPADFTIDPGENMAVLLYTGGTTGEPKGAILTHRNIIVNTMQFAHWYDFRPGEEISLCTIPMSHSGGMSGVMNVPLYAGATLVVMKRFFPEPVARAIEKYHVTRFFGVPTMYASLLNNQSARKCCMTSLKACRTNAAPLPVAVKQAFDDLIGREVLVEGYGLTETSPLTHANPLQKPKAGSIGIPLPDTDCKLVDLGTGKALKECCEGEIVIRGPQVMKGYWNKPEATAKVMSDGWFRTGDVGKMDEEGYFFVVDRLKDMIICGGYKIWPREVEEALYKHPEVCMAMVVGVPDDYYGEVPKAFIVLKDPAGNNVSKDEIVAFCKKNMAAYKMPRIVEFCEQLPLSPQGKVLKRLVREKEREAFESSKSGCERVCKKR